MFKTFLFLISILSCYSLFSQRNKIEEVKKLILLSEKTQDTNSDKSLLFAFRAKKIAEDINDITLITQVFYQISHSYFNKGIVDSSIIYCDSILQLSVTDNKITGKTNSFLSIVYRRKGDYNKAIKYAENSVKIYSKIKDSDGIAESKFNLGKIYHSTGQNKKAIEIYFEVLKYYQKQKNVIEQAQVLGSVSNVYMDIGDEKKGAEYIRKALKILEPYQNTGMFADNLNNYGICFYNKQEYDSAQYYYKRALRIYKKIDRKDAVAAAYQNLGITYIYINKTKKGFEYLKQALIIFRELHLNDEISVMTDLGDGYKYVNNTDSADYYLTKAYKLAIKTNDTYYIKETLKLLFELYDKNNKYKNALFFYKRYVTFKDSIDNEKMKKALSNIEIKYQTSEKEKEIIRLKDKELLEKANTRLLIIGIISIIIIFILIIIRIQTKRKKDSEIQRQKILVHRKEKELVKAKLKQKELEEKRLKNELEFKTKQLVTHALNMMQKNKLLQEISSHISAQANTLESEEKKYLFRIKKQLEQGLNIDKDWDLFKIYFEQLNEAFFVKLKEINPKLTGNDFRLCALTKLNLSLKETASVLNISSESAKNARYRLKKKLKLKEGENLNRFLNSL